MLSQADTEFLKSLGFPFEVKAGAQETLVIIKEVRLASRYKPETAEILIRIPAGYPSTKLDNFYASPDIGLVNGGSIPNLSAATIEGRIWQQWSRHIQEGQWRPSEDCLQTYWFGLVWKELLQ